MWFKTTLTHRFSGVSSHQSLGWTFWRVGVIKGSSLLQVQEPLVCCMPRNTESKEQWYTENVRWFEFDPWFLQEWIHRLARRDEPQSPPHPPPAITAGALLAPEMSVIDQVGDRAVEYFVVTFFLRLRFSRSRFMFQYGGRIEWLQQKKSKQHNELRFVCRLRASSRLCSPGLRY